MKEGVSGLEMDYSPGKPSKLTEDQQKQLANVITNQRPVDVGFKAKYTWTLDLVAAWIKREFDESYTPKGASKLLKRLGFSYTKATYTLKRADLEK